MARARKNGSKWRGEFRYGGCWFPVKRRGRAVLFGSAEAARAAAEKAAPG